ncbi:hypothetical protein [Azohydromonas aeria]|uniref:hypothetical protein n=1 Tax=Azohydromonas aeria TaxID=2590212 RepID=UPI0012FC4EB8|nr:hypothetical protein [Azohydromonas aeria]
MDALRITTTLPADEAAALERLLGELLGRYVADLTEKSAAGATRMRQALAEAISNAKEPCRG